MTDAETPTTDAAQRIGQFITLTERLTGLVAEQAKAFESRRPQDAAVHLEEIGRLANLYRHESARVRGNIALVSTASPSDRRRLYRATEAFDAVLARQDRALSAAKVVTEGLVQALALEVAKQRQQGSTYGADATTSTSTLAATAITLNRRA